MRAAGRRSAANSASGSCGYPFCSSARAGADEEGGVGEGSGVAGVVPVDVGEADVRDGCGREAAVLQRLGGVGGHCQWLEERYAANDCRGVVVMVLAVSEVKKEDVLGCGVA